MRKNENQAPAEGPTTPGKGRIINPWNFAKELVEAVESDPGTEHKAMLFSVDDEEVHFVRARSEARVMVLEFTRRGLKALSPATNPPPEETPDEDQIAAAHNAAIEDDYDWADNDTDPW